MRRMRLCERKNPGLAKKCVNCGHPVVYEVHARGATCMHIDQGTMTAACRKCGCGEPRVVAT